MISTRSGLAGLLLLLPLHAARAQAPMVTVAEPTITIEGRVVDQRGEPIPVARVWVTGARDPDVVLREGIADGEGVFRLLRVPRHDWHLVAAEAPGYCAVRTRCADDPFVELRLQEATTVRGVVQDRAGDPAPGVTVVAQAITLALPGAFREATSDAAGRFEIAGVALAPVRFLAVVPGEGLATASAAIRGVTDVNVRAGDPGMTSLRARIALPHGVRGLAITPMLAAREAGVELRLPAGLPWRNPEDGIFVLEPVPDLDYELGFLVPGHRTSPTIAQLTHGQGPHNQHVLAEPTPRGGFSYRALVRDSVGKPVADLDLVLRSQSGFLPSSASSNAQGEAVFQSALPPGERFVLTADDDRWALASSTAQVRNFGQPELRRHVSGYLDAALTIDLRAVEAGVIHGRVVDADGQPVRYARVTLEAEASVRFRAVGRLAEQGTSPVASMFAGADGSFRFGGLHPGAQRVRVSAATPRAAATTEFARLDEAGTKPLVLELRPAATIAGVLTDAHDQPVPGVELWLRPADVDNGHSHGTAVKVVTDRQGRYRFVGVQPGGVALQLGSVGYATGPFLAAPFAVKSGETIQRDLQLPAR